jgi:hypothetical protein
MPRSLSRGVSEMHTRCAYCGGKFGLVRQQWFQTQFCSKRCREKFLTKLTKAACYDGPSAHLSSRRVYLNLIRPSAARAIPAPIVLLFLLSRGSREFVPS